MIDFVTITSQGQISIPASMRKQFELKPGDKLSIELEDTRLVLKPVEDIKDKHMGILRDKAKVNYGKALDEILLLEDKALDDYIALKYDSKRKKK